MLIKPCDKRGIIVIVQGCACWHKVCFIIGMNEVKQTKSNGVTIMNTNAKTYMNTETGSTGTYNEWWYENESGDQVNAVDLGEVVEL